MDYGETSAGLDGQMQQEVQWETMDIQLSVCKGAPKARRMILEHESLELCRRLNKHSLKGSVCVCVVLDRCGE